MGIYLRPLASFSTRYTKRDTDIRKKATYGRRDRLTSDRAKRNTIPRGFGTAKNFSRVGLRNSAKPTRVGTVKIKARETNSANWIEQRNPETPHGRISHFPTCGWSRFIPPTRKIFSFFPLSPSSSSHLCACIFFGGNPWISGKSA